VVGAEADLHDYSYREWSGMMNTFYRPCWEVFIQSAKADLAGHPEPPVDFYAWESAWTRRTDTYPSRPTGDPVTVASRLLHKYGSP
jgi:alpha-N-acetylglucosaminidase